MRATGARILVHGTGGPRGGGGVLGRIGGAVSGANKGARCYRCCLQTRSLRFVEMIALILFAVANRSQVAVPF